MDNLAHRSTFTIEFTGHDIDHDLQREDYANVLQDASQRIKELLETDAYLRLMLQSHNISMQIVDSSR